MVKKIFKCSAVWCGPCRLMEQIFHKISQNEKYQKIEFSTIDVDDIQNKELLIKYKIRNIPVIILVDDMDNEIDRITGVVSIDNITNVIDKHLS